MIFVTAAGSASAAEAASHPRAAGESRSVLDVPAVSIAKLSFKIDVPEPTSEAAFEAAMANPKARQTSEERMAAVLAGEVKVYEAGQLHGQEKIDFLEHAARAGDAAAAAALGSLFDWGEELPADPVRALGYFRAAAIGGRMEAAHNVGAAYAGGRGASRDFVEALAWLMVARERGDRSGADEELRQHLLAWNRPAVIERAEARAVELRRKATNEEIAAALPAPSELTWIESGTAAAGDPTAKASPPASQIVVFTILGERLVWPTLADLEHAAAREEPAALDALGRLLAAGKDMPADPLRAVVLLERSAALGNIDAAHQLGELYSGGPALRRDPTKAFQYHLAAAKGGSVLAMASVGVDFTNGSGTSRDLVQGLAWLIAAKHFHVDLGQEAKLRAFLAQHRPADVARAEGEAAKLMAGVEARRK